MRKLIFTFILFTFVMHCFSQSDSKSMDQKLFGTWSGSEKDGQEQGMIKNWIMHRFIDGTFVLLFTTVKGETVDNFAEKGNWWIDSKGIFHEYHNNSKLTDTYNYKVLDDNHIQFKAVKVGVEMNNTEYEFIDTRVDDGV